MSEPITPEELRAKAENWLKYPLDRRRAAAVLEDAAAEIERLTARVATLELARDRAIAMAVEGAEASHAEIKRLTAAQIAALQRERELERLPEKQLAMGRAHAAEAFGGEVEAE